MLCAVKSCGYKEKVYGVCGVHKRYAFKIDHPDFQILESLYVNIFDESKKLEQLGIDILQIQQFLGYNLASTQEIKFTEPFTKLGFLLINSKQLISRLSEVHGNVIACNKATILQHKILQNCNCKCTLCSLI